MGLRGIDLASNIIMSSIRQAMDFPSTSGCSKHQCAVLQRGGGVGGTRVGDRAGEVGARGDLPDARHGEDPELAGYGGHETTTRASAAARAGSLMMVSVTTSGP